MVGGPGWADRFGPLNWRVRRVGLQRVDGLEIPTRPALFLAGRPPL